MRRILAFMLAGLVLASCGVDGQPIRPEPKKAGVSVTGTARIGVAGGL